MYAAFITCIVTFRKYYMHREKNSNDMIVPADKVLVGTCKAHRKDLLILSLWHHWIEFEYKCSWFYKGIKTKQVTTASHKTSLIKSHKKKNQHHSLLTRDPVVHKHFAYWSSPVNDCRLNKTFTTLKILSSDDWHFTTTQLSMASPQR